MVNQFKMKSVQLSSEMLQLRLSKHNLGLHELLEIAGSSLWSDAVSGLCFP